MFKKILTVMTGVILTVSLAACAGSTEDYTEYKKEMSNFFESVNTLNEEMNALNPDDAEAVNKLFEYLDQVEEQFKYFSEIEVPNQYKVTESLADEAYDYMKEANEYFRQSFSENSYNEYTLEAAMECYSRANKRMQYVIDIIHGKLPEDENISFE
ncbi:MAG: hypothetical protein J6U67_05715 [Lachnospiraceae bacterium]|nr:hypothetical protein [Lachnospiraceae bacterium]